MYLVIWCCEIEKLRWIDGLEKKKKHREILKGGRFWKRFFEIGKLRMREMIESCY